MWQQWVNALLGLWVIVVPFVGFSSNAMTWTLAITGIIIALLGFWGAVENSPERTSDNRRLQHQS